MLNHAELNAIIYKMDKKVDNFLFEKESYIIRGAAFEIYKKFRNTQKERAYLNAFANELKFHGLSVEIEKQLPVYYRDKKVGTYVPDLVVDDKICIELKAKPFFSKQDKEQFWHYLKNSDFRLGFLINFGASNGVEIVRRVYDIRRNSA